MIDDVTFPKQFAHSSSEPRIWNLWESRAAFAASVDRTKKPFCVVMPPPNVTGILHMGHVLDNIPQDVMTRWHRMRGFSAVWIPGTDHAGIATQNVVKRQLDKEGINFRDFGREKFIEKVWEWKEKSGRTIIDQLKRLGCSCDWSRERFTMDEQLSFAVREAFIRWYSKGLIYKGKRMINWCTVCGTALANDEVERQERQGSLWHIKYPLMVDGSPSPTEGLIVATTRPETMLGDVAVAVHPDDERYKAYHGKKLFLPIQNREISIIVDDFVDLTFGSGVVKITPAHDLTDYAVGTRHNLPALEVIGAQGKMTELAGAYRGLDRFEARKAIVKDLETLGALEKVDAHRNAVGQCYRCNSVIEPLISDQWFVKMRPLAEKAKAAVVDGRIQVTPESEKNDYFHWMDSIEDWCISRQLWWGHRIPIYYCEGCETPHAAHSSPSACEKCGAAHFRQDEDVLDTWFSSQLWPFSTLGWPEKTPELDYWYPNNWLLSGRDILFFWDSRMIMSGLELLGEVPFRTLVLHGLVRDEQGRKLSKSLGNSPDPLELFDTHGTDAVRAAIALRYPLGRQDSRLSDELFRNGTALVTKLWNSCRFALMNLTSEEFTYDKKSLKLTAIEDRWIISRLHHTIKEHDHHLEANDISHAIEEVHSFFWNDVCDWYLEITKPRLKAQGETSAQALSVSLVVLKETLKLFHPYIPFVTEELWQLLKSNGVKDLSEGSEATVIATSPWPLPSEFPVDKEAETLFDEMMSLIRGIRDVRANLVLPPKGLLKVELPYFEKRNFFEVYQNTAQAIGFVESFTILEEGKTPEKKIPFRFAGGLGFITLPDSIDREDLAKKLSAKIEKLEKSIASTNARLANEEFIRNAPPHLVEEAKNQLLNIEEARDKIQSFCNSLR